MSNNLLMCTEQCFVDTVWLNQDEIAALFNVDRTRITRYINIFKDEELAKSSIVEFFITTIFDSKIY